MTKTFFKVSDKRAFTWNPVISTKKVTFKGRNSKWILSTESCKAVCVLYFSILCERSSILVRLHTRTTHAQEHCSNSNKLENSVCVCGVTSRLHGYFLKTYKIRWYLFTSLFSLCLIAPKPRCGKWITYCNKRNYGLINTHLTKVCPVSTLRSFFIWKS